MIVRPLNDSFQKSLDSAARKYAATVEPALEYLQSRGFDRAAAERFGLGFVESPIPGHESQQGKLAIPYYTMEGRVCGLRFRSIPGLTLHADPKYYGFPGVENRVYGCQTLTDPYATRVVLAEGEIEAMTLALCGYTALGVPGASAWKKHQARIVEGYETVYVIAEGDKAGRDFASKVARDIRQSHVIQLPDGEDINSLFVAEGKDRVDDLFQH